MGKSKLKAALDAHKGVDYQKLKEKKKQKAGEKRKRDKEQKRIEENGDDEDMSGDDDEGGVLIDEEAVGTEIDEKEEAKLQAELKALLGNKKKLMEIDSGSEVDEEEEGDDDEWESAAEDLEDEAASEDDAEDDVESEEDDQVANLARLADSESESDSDDEEEAQEKHTAVNGSIKTNGITVDELEAVGEENDEEEDAEGRDIPLSDIDSLASEERGDIVPHQRLTINNKAALKTSLERISLPFSTMPFSLHQTITSQTNTANSIPDIDDDLKRELAFYAQSLDAVKRARKLLEKEGVLFTRPNDYFAEMVKSDEHMGKVKDKLRDEAAAKKASSEARRQRDLKKFGKQVQVAKMQERAKEKRENLERINVLKRKRAGALPASENEPDLFDVSLEDSATTAKKDREARRSASGGAPNAKRQKKDAKYGFGGKKRFSKSGDAESTNDMRKFPGKNMKKPFKGAAAGKSGKMRPGKSKRAKAKF